MGRNSKFSQKFKLRIAQEYLEGNESSLTLAKKYGCGDHNVRRWVAQYRSQGEAAFKQRLRNQVYTKEFKHMVDEEYGIGGYQNVL